MNKRTHTPTILALLIAAVLAGAYVIVAANNAAMGGAVETPAGLLHQHRVPLWCEHQGVESACWVVTTPVASQ